MTEQQLLEAMLEKIYGEYWRELYAPLPDTQD